MQLKYILTTKQLTSLRMVDDSKLPISEKEYLKAQLIIVYLKDIIIN